MSDFFHLIIYLKFISILCLFSYSVTMKTDPSEDRYLINATSFKNNALKHRVKPEFTRVHSKFETRPTGSLGSSSLLLLELNSTKQLQSWQERTSPSPKLLSKTGQRYCKSGKWAPEEHTLFLNLVQSHGKDWKTISKMMGGTRSKIQVNIHPYTPHIPHQ